MSKLKDVVRARSTNVIRLKRGRDSRSHVGSRAGSRAGSPASNILIDVAFWAFSPAKPLDMLLPSLIPLSIVRRNSQGHLEKLNHYKITDRVDLLEFDGVEVEL